MDHLTNLFLRDLHLLREVHQGWDGGRVPYVGGDEVPSLRSCLGKEEEGRLSASVVVGGVEDLLHLQTSTCLVAGNLGVEIHASQEMKVLSKEANGIGLDCRQGQGQDLPCLQEKQRRMGIHPRKRHSLTIALNHSGEA